MSQAKLTDRRRSGVQRCVPVRLLVTGEELDLFDPTAVAAEQHAERFARAAGWHPQQ
jgi:hypothetical protein